MSLKGQKKHLSRNLIFLFPRVKSKIRTESNLSRAGGHPPERTPAPVLAPSPFEDKFGCWGRKRGPWRHGWALCQAPASPGQRLIIPDLGQGPLR